MTKPIKANSKNERKPLTQERLREHLHYDQDTGIFIHRVEIRTGRWRRNIGVRAGALDPRGYRWIFIDGCRYWEHRLAWLYVHGRWPIDQIDHINCDKSDNRICNLREATRSQNSMNSKISRINTSGYKGVYFSKKRNKWAAEIKINGNKKFLGYFNAAKKAHIAYWDAAQGLFGKFARIG